MKKTFTLLFALCSYFAHAQFVHTLTLKATLTPHQIDSVLQGQGVPSGVFPLNYSVSIYKVVYNTVDWDSNATTASGLLCMPLGTPCKVSMLSYQHGTITKKSDAPSRLQSEWFIGLAAASIGYVSVLPDYLGLGDGPGLHPYQHAHTEATAVIDMIRAGKQVVDSLGTPVNDQLFLFGYSQGGHATMAAHQLIQEKLDSVMHVTASAPMSGAYDMSGVMANLMVSDSTYPSPYYLPFLMFGYNEVYHLFAHDSDVMVHPYDSILPPLFDGTHSGNAIDSKMPSVPKLILQPFQVDSFINDSVNNFLRVRLRENNTYNWLPTSPIKMYYCQGDHSVPYQNSIVAYHHFIANGAGSLVDTVDVNPTLDHYPCAQFAILTATSWFNTLVYQPLTSRGITIIDNNSATTPDGSLTAIPNNGNPGYTYVWNTGDTTATITGLAAGKYFVTVTDRSGCSYVDSATVQLANGLQDQVLVNVRVYPNPTRGMVNIENTDPADNIKQAEVFNLNGQLINTYTIRQGNNIQLYFDNAAQGIYYLRLRAESGKELKSKLTVL